MKKNIKSKKSRYYIFLKIDIQKLKTCCSYSILGIALLLEFFILINIIII